jgi:hypothetical protein
MISFLLTAIAASGKLETKYLHTYSHLLLVELLLCTEWSLKFTSSTSVVTRRVTEEYSSQNHALDTFVIVTVQFI